MSFAVTDPRFDPPAPAEQPPVDGGEFQDDRPKGRGCFFWGCLTLTIGLLVMTVVGLVAAYFATRHFVNLFTADAPLNIVAVELPEEEMQALEARFEAFDESLKKGEPLDLEVTAKEINAMITQDDQFKGHVLVRIADGKVGGDISIPASDFPGGAGRHFNASVNFNVSMKDGALEVTLTDAAVNGSPLSKTIMAPLTGKNLAKDAYKDPKNAEVLRKFESLEIVGDKIILRARKQPAEAPVPPVAPEIEAPEIETIEEAEVPANN